MSSSKQSSQKPTPSRPWLSRFLIKSATLVAGLGLCGALLGTLALALAWPNLPDLSAMIDYRPRVPLRIYTADKVLIGEFGEERRNVLRFDEIPDIMKSAILAAEDDRFYQHGGIDWAGVLRAALANTIHMSKTQGASTITMQVARNFYLSSEKTYTRKFYELLLTFKIEATLTKDEILDLYMNQIFLGHRAYGFAAASRSYFGKPLGEITPAEAAMLAGIPKAPSRFNPISNFQRAKSRQAYVLGRMRSLGYLNEDEYQQAMAQEIVIKSAAGTPTGRYTVHGEYPAELARQLLYGVYQDDIYSRGFNIYTTIDSKGQEAAYQSLREGVLDYTRRAPYPGPEETISLPEGIEGQTEAFNTLLDELQEKYPDNGDLLTGVVLSASPTEVKVARSATDIIEITDKRALRVVARGLTPKASDKVRIERGSVVYIHQRPDYWELLNKPTVQAALVSLQAQDGAIKSMVGGFDFEEGKFNRVTQAWRQPGSAFKPFIYASSLERGLTPATQISDEPFFLTAEQTGSKPWSPKNYGSTYEPMLTMRQGLYKSKNMISIRIMQAVGPKYVQDYVTRFGFDRSRQPAVLPLALGAGSVTPLQLAGGYAVFANGGYRVPPYLIDHVTDSSGKIIMRARPTVAGDVAARAIDPRTVYVMDDLLRGVATSGTGARAHRELKRDDIGGKTGTTNDSQDAWFAGFTPKLVAVAWMGYDQPRSLGQSETGGGAALPIWVGYMREALQDQPQIPPGPMPSGLSRINGDFYFDEFPPGVAVARVGLPAPGDAVASGAPDRIGDLLNQLGGGTPQGSPATNSSNGTPATALPVKVPFLMISFTLRTSLRALGISSVLVLAACGQKGPLTMPSTPPPPPPEAALTAPPTVSPTAPAPAPAKP